LEIKRLLFSLIAASILVTGCTKKPATDAKTLLHRAAKSGDVELVQSLIAGGANINAQDKNNWAPLHYAVKKGHKKIADLLLANGADVNVKTDEGITPLHLTNSSKEIAELLVSKGADLNAKGGSTG